MDRASQGARPLTEDKTRLAAMLGLPKTSVVHGDALVGLLRVLVSMGCIGGNCRVCH